MTEIENPNTSERKARDLIRELHEEIFGSVTRLGGKCLSRRFS